MANKKYKPEVMAEAIRKSGGVLSEAARIVGCTRKTLRSYREEYEIVQEAWDDENEIHLDKQEVGLLDFCEGRVDGQTTRERLDAIKFYLRTKGRERGYGDRQDVDMTTGGEKITGVVFTKPGD